MDTVSRTLPCGLCSTPVPEAHFRAGTARMFQGVLYCNNCSREAEQARQETLAFRQSLVQGGLYSCSKCAAPVPYADVRDGKAVYHSGELSCAECSKDLRSILRVPGAATGTHRVAGAKSTGSVRIPGAAVPANTSRPPMPTPVPTAPPPAGSTSSTQVPLRLQPQATPQAGSNSSTQVPVRTPSGRLTPQPPGPGAQAPRGASSRLMPVANIPAAPVVPQNPAEEGDAGLTMIFDAVMPIPPKPVAPQDPVKKTSGRLTPEVFATPAGDDDGEGGRTMFFDNVIVVPKVGASRKCPICDAEVPPGKEFVHQGQVYCLGCRTKIVDLVAKSMAEGEELSSFKCGACGSTVSADDIVAEKAIRYRGEIYCEICKRDRIRQTAARPAGTPTPPGGAAPPIACAKCQRPIPAVEVRTGNTFEVDGQLQCKKCRDEAEAAFAEFEKHAAKRVTCSHCNRAISPKEIADRKITQWNGQTFCAICGRDPAVVLRGKESEAKPGVCRVCGAAIDPGQTGECGECRGEMTKALEFSMNASVELEQVTQKFSCAKDGCTLSFTQAEVRAGKATIVGREVFCPAHAKEGAASAKAGAKAGKDVGAKSCPICAGPLGAAPFAYAGKQFCSLCKPEFEAVLVLSKKPPGKNAVCASCKKPAGQGTVNLGAQVFCASCTKQAETAIQAIVRERRAKRAGLLPVLAKLVAVGTVAAIGFIIYQQVTAAVQQKPIPMKVRATPPWEGTLTKAIAIANRPNFSYEEAVAALNELAPLEAELKDVTECQEQLRSIHARAVANRDGFGPKLAADMLGKAATAFGDGDRPSQALTALDLLKKFPPELEETPAGQEVVGARQRYEAFGACARASVSTGGAAERLATLKHVFDMREAQLCDLGKTSLGKRLNDELRILDNEDREKKLQKEKNPGGEEANAKDVKMAREYEEKKDFDKSEEIYRQVLERDSQSWPALVGLARSALEHNRLAEARSLGKRALTIDPKPAEARVVQAWLEFTDGNLEGHERAAKTIKGISDKDLGVPGRRLKAFLSLGPPKFDGRSLRWYGRGVLDNECRAIAHVLEDTIVKAAGIYALDAETLRTTVVVLPKEKVDELRNKLELGNSLQEVPSSCYAVVCPVGTPLSEIQRFIGIALGLRCADAPSWIRGGLPIALSGIRMAKSELTLDKIDHLPMDKFMRDPKLVAAAVHYCSVIDKPEGA